MDLEVAKDKLAKWMSFTWQKANPARWRIKVKKKIASYWSHRLLFINTATHNIKAARSICLKFTFEHASVGMYLPCSYQILYMSWTTLKATLDILVVAKLLSWTWHVMRELNKLRDLSSNANRKPNQVPGR